MFKGSIVALVTPFDEVGNVNYKKLAELTQFHLDNKTDGIVALGTTAESSTLTFDEEVKILETILSVVKKKIPVIVGCASNNTQTVVKHATHFKKMGVDGLLAITPFYNRTNEEGMIKHFSVIADNVDLPVILYNIPGRTGCSISEHAISVLSKHKNIVGIKEASGDMSYAMKVAKYVNENFLLYSGNDDIIVPIMSIGGSGVISAWANIMPKEAANLVRLCFDGKFKEASSIQTKYLDLINSLFIETNPIPVKAALNHLGFNVGGLRLPLYQMGESNLKTLITNLEKIK